jgi:hypothetical protein
MPCLFRSNSRQPGTYAVSVGCQLQITSAHIFVRNIGPSDDKNRVIDIISYRAFIA